MVADLQLDSRRWLQEGRGSPHVRDATTVKHPNKPLVNYQDSQTHQSRQYYGPSTPAAPIQEPSPAYGHSSGGSYPRESTAHPGYSSGRQPAPAAPYPSDPAYTYSQPPPGYIQQGNYYVPASSAQPGYQQPRTTPTTTYPYPPPSGGREPEPQFDPRDPRYSAYAVQQPPPSSSSRHAEGYSPSTRYFRYDGLVHFPPQC